MFVCIIEDEDTPTGLTIENRVHTILQRYMLCMAILHWWFITLLHH